MCVCVRIFNLFLLCFYWKDILTALLSRVRKTALNRCIVLACEELCVILNSNYFQIVNGSLCFFWFYEHPHVCIDM